MEDDKQVTSLQVGINSFADLAVECWRLGRCLSAIDENNQKVALNYIHRKLNRFIEDNGLQALDISGQSFDPGLALEVIETIETEGVPQGTSIVGEMTSPIVLHEGRVIRHGIAPVHKWIELRIPAEDSNG